MPWQRNQDRQNLENRIRRKLAKSGERLRIPRGLAESRAIGIHTIHERSGFITGAHYSLAELARLLQVPQTTRTPKKK